MKKMIVLIIMLLLVFQGCSANKKTSGENILTTTTPAVTQPAPTITVSPVPATPTPRPLVLPVLTNDTGKVMIQTVSSSITYPTTSFIITSVNGEKIVVDGTEMPKKAILDINPAAIISTHDHPDHNDAVFVKSNPNAQVLKYKEGEIQTNDFHIYSVKASHKGDVITGTNYIMVIEVDGLRIAHMGDIGQTEMTKEQLEAMGEIDIAFMQFDNSYSDMNMENMKGFHLIEQVNPKIIIPTHYTAEDITKLSELYGDVKEVENLIEISKEDLPAETLKVYHVTNTLRYR